MGNYEELKQAVSDVIKTNGNQEITGSVLQNALLTIISTIGTNATFAGIATPETNPGTPDQNVFWIASKNGVYSNFNAIEVNNEVILFVNENGSWVKKNTGIATREQTLNISKRNYTENESLNNLIKEIYCVNSERGSVYIKNIHRQGGTGDVRGYIVAKINDQEYNIVLENPPRVADADGNVIKAIAGGVIVYFLIDWGMLEPGTGTNNSEYYQLSDNAYTLSSNPQIHSLLSSEFHVIKPNSIITNSYVFMVNGEILTTNGYNINVYEISYNRKYKIKGNLNGTTTFAVYSNYDDGVLSGLLYLYSKGVNETVSVDEIIQGYSGYLAVSWNKLDVEVLADGLDDLLSNVDDLNYRLSYNELMSKDGYEQGYINTSGQLVEHAQYTADYYSVTQDEKYRILGTYQGISGVAALSYWKDDNFIKTVINTNSITLPGEKIDIDSFFTIPLGVNKVYITNTYGNTLFLYKLEEVKKIEKDVLDENLLSKITIAGNEVNIEKEENGKYLNVSGSYSDNPLYIIREYSVNAGEKYKIKGTTRGTKDVALYALYAGSATQNNLKSIYSLVDFYGGTFEGARQATIDFFIEIPKNVTTIATCSTPSDNDDMKLLDIANTKDYIDKIVGLLYVDCLGDSLTMGATRFGWYEDSLQNLLGKDYMVRNWGVGGESSASIMARQGSDCIKFQKDWILKADMTPTLVMNNDGLNITITTQTYNNVVALLLQGAENDPGQQSRVVNPCYINGIECTMTYTQGSGFAKGLWYMKRNNVGDRDIIIPKNTPVYFNTGKEMGKSDITIIWMGTNDGGYSNWQDLVNKQVMATNKVSNKKFIVIGLHKLNKENGEQYESLMRNTFGNKFFNIREYMSTNMIYDAGIEPTEEDLQKMALGECPPSLLYDNTHLKPESNDVLGKKLYKLCFALGYLI